MTRLVVVAEDDRHIARLVELALEPLGLAVERLADGLAALERLGRAPPPDLVVLDLTLPGLGGLEVLGRLRGEGPARAVPVLVLSARGDAQRRAALEAGATEYLSKPFDVEQLAALAARLLAAGPAPAAAAERAP